MATGNKLLEQNDEGKLILNGNELKVVSTIPEGDAAFVKVIAPYVDGESGGGGGFSIDCGDEGRNFPLVEILGAMFQGGAEGKIVVLRKGTGPNPDDPDYQTVMEFTSEGIEFKVPVKGAAVTGGGQSILQSPNGRVVLAAQDDLNLVLYIDGKPVKAIHGLGKEDLW